MNKKVVMMKSESLNDIKKLLIEIEKTEGPDTLSIWIMDMIELRKSIDDLEVEIHKLQERQIVLQRAFIIKWANMPKRKVVTKKGKGG